MTYDSSLIFKLPLYTLYIILRSSIKMRNFFRPLKLNKKKNSFFLKKQNPFCWNIVEGILVVSLWSGLIILFYSPKSEHCEFLPNSQFSVIIYFVTISNFDPWSIQKNITENLRILNCSLPQNQAWFGALRHSRILIYLFYSFFWAKIL